MENITGIQKELKRYSRNGIDATGRYPLRVQEAVRCLKTHFFEPGYTIEEMNEACDINRHNFSVHFKHYTGRTPKQYILYHRIEAAKKLLDDEAFEDLTAGDLSFELGFSGISAYSNCFKKQTGMRPIDWKNRTNNTD